MSKLKSRRILIIMKSFIRKHTLTIQLSIIFIVILITAIAAQVWKTIDFPTSLSIFAVLIAITILLISTNEIRNRLRPWVAVHEIQVNEIENRELASFYIKNTGPIPATRVGYTARWFFKQNDKWRQDQRLKDWTLPGTRNMLFPNQQIGHEAQMHTIKTVAENRDIKVTFKIKYNGLWSKHTTTNTFKYSYTRGAWSSAWVIDEPQDYT